jgi:hypothetical protein
MKKANMLRHSEIGLPITSDVLTFRQSCILVPLPDLVNRVTQLVAGAHAAGHVTA